MVEAAIAMVGIVLSGPNLLRMFVPIQSAVLEERPTPCHGRLLLLCLCCEQGRESRFAWQDGHRFCCWCLRYRLTWKRLFSSRSRYGFHFHGNRSFISGASRW